MVRHASTARPRTGSAARLSNTQLLTWTFLLLVIGLTAMVRIRLLNIPLERDEGEYAYAGQLLLHGVPPYREAFNMKFPGAYGAYAVIMAVFGQTTTGIRLGLLLLNACSIVLVFLLGRRLFGNPAGMAAAAAYALLSTSTGILGIEAHATHFVVAAALGATLLLLSAVDTGKSQALFWCGLLYGVAILMKQHGAFFLIFGGLYLVWRRCRPRQLAIFFFGSAVPLALTGLALWYAGVFGKFWFWTIRYAREYATELSLAEGWGFFKFEFPRVASANILLWLLAGAGLVLIWRRKEDRASAVFVSAFLVFSIFGILPGLWFREHYFILMTPALALLAGAVVRSKAKWTWVLFIAVLAISVARQADSLFLLGPLESSREFNGFNPFPEAVEIADYIRSHSEPSALIAVLGSEPEIYFYAGRRSATGYIYTYGLMENQPFALTMQKEMMAEVERAVPEYVVFVNVQSSWGTRRDSHLDIIDWWSSYSTRQYDLVAIADMVSPERTEYRWENAESYSPKSRQFLAIYRKKNAAGRIRRLR